MWKADNSFRINGEIMYFTLDYFDQMDVLYEVSQIIDEFW